MDFGIERPQILLLKAALSTDKAAAAAALAEWWRGIADFDAVRGTDAALFPRIYWNLGSAIQDAQLRARLKGTARHHWVRNQYLIANCGKLLDLFEAAAMPVLLLKGAAIATTIDDDPGLRAMSDCDMLVPRSRALEAVELLSRAGLLQSTRVGERDLNSAHGVTLDLGNQYARCDVHWRPVRPIGAPELGAEMFAAARSVNFTGRACLAPSPEHLVFHAIVHGTDWSPYPRYDWLADTVKILMRTGAGFDWDQLVDIARRYRFGFLVGSALETARDKAGIPVPASAVRRLRRPWALFERREAPIRRSRPSSLSIADELVLMLQTIRRQDGKHLARSAARAVPTLIQSLWGPFSASRSFIHDDRREPVAFLQGWSPPEPDGRWTEGKLVSCALYAPSGARPTSLCLRGTPFAHGATKPHIVDVYAGWRRLATLRWRTSGLGPVVQQVALPATIWRGETAVIRFRVRSPACPIDTGYNGDTRAVGIFVAQLSTTPAVRDVEDRPIELSRNGPDIDVLWHGWSSPGPRDCWTDGKLAVMRWRAARDLAGGSILGIEIAASARNVGRLAGRIAINGVPTGSFDFAAQQRDLVLEYPLPRTIPAGREVEVAFAISRTKPATAGAAFDRHRGLAIRRLSIKPPAPHS